MPSFSSRSATLTIEGLVSIYRTGSPWHRDSTFLLINGAGLRRRAAPGLKVILRSESIAIVAIINSRRGTFYGFPVRRSGPRSLAGCAAITASPSRTTTSGHKLADSGCNGYRAGAYASGQEENPDGAVSDRLAHRHGRSVTWLTDASAKFGRCIYAYGNNPDSCLSWLIVLKKTYVPDGDPVLAAAIEAPLQWPRWTSATAHELLVISSEGRRCSPAGSERSAGVVLGAFVMYSLSNFVGVNSPGLQSCRQCLVVEPRPSVGLP